MYAWLNVFSSFFTYVISRIQIFATVPIISTLIGTGAICMCGLLISFSFGYYFPISVIRPVPWPGPSRSFLTARLTSCGRPCSIIVINWLTAPIDPNNPTSAYVYVLNESLYIRWPCLPISCQQTSSQARQSLALANDCNWPVMSCAVHS